MNAPSHRARFAAGVALAAALGAWATRGFVQQARTDDDARAEERKAVVAVQSLAELSRRAGGDGESVRKGIAAWKAQAPMVAQARVLILNGLRLEASTAPGDGAPRRLKREEKPFYDRGQRIATAVRTNREEQTARKAEIEIARLPGGRLSVAAPLESGEAVIGLVEIETAAPPPRPSEGFIPYALAVVAPLLLFGAGALTLGERRALLAALGATCIAASLFFLWRSSTGRLAHERAQASASVADAAARQAALLQGTAVSPAAWDVDAYRRPRGLITSAGAVDEPRLAAASAEVDRALDRSIFAVDLLALGALLFVGFGGLSGAARTVSKNRQAYLYIAPAIAGMLVLVFFPFFYGITLSFTDSNLYNTAQPLSEIWIGLKNYQAILGDFAIVRQTESGRVVNYLNFYWTLAFTLVWTVTNVACGVTSGLILALILNTKNLAARPIYRVLLILPWALPNYITALIWKGMFHRQFGVINHVIEMFGGRAISWFDQPLTSFLTALATNGWLSFPFMMVVSLGALQSIPADLYEAARVDGASRWQQFKAITLPSLRPALVPAVIISVVWTFNMFNIIYLVTAGEPGGATEILVTQAYKFAFERYRYGYAAAYSTIIFGILLVYGTIQNRVSRATEA